MLIDLQLHSTYSDGYLSPTRVAEFMSRQGVKVASLTDHNTVSGQDEFRQACARLNIKSITGLEIYTKLHNYRFSILWYNFNENDPELHSLLRGSQLRRRRQIRQILQEIKSRGLKLDIERIIDKYNHYVPANQIVDDIWNNKANRQKIRKLLGIQKPREGDIMAEYFYNSNYGRLNNSYIDLEAIIKLKKKIGGQVVLCHPAKRGFSGRKYLNDLKAVGLDGIELLSPHHSYGAIVYLQQQAKELNLLETGGSDFHCFEGNRSPVQHSWQYYKVDSNLLAGVKKIIG